MGVKKKLPIYQGRGGRILGELEKLTVVESSAKVNALGQIGCGEIRCRSDGGRIEVFIRFRTHSRDQTQKAYEERKRLMNYYNNIDIN